MTSPVIQMMTPMWSDALSLLWWTRAEIVLDIAPIVLA